MSRHLPTQPAEKHIMRRHATAVCVRGEGVLLVGESGVGKSDLAARLIASGAQLIADDQVDLALHGSSLWLSAPPNLSGVFELFGVGLITMPCVEKAKLRLIVQCVAGVGERAPERKKWVYESVVAEEITLDPLHGSSPAKIQLLVEALQADKRLSDEWMPQTRNNLHYS